MKRHYRFLIICVALISISGLVWQIFLDKNQNDKPVKPRSTITPKLKTESIIKGLSNPWDVGFSDTGTMFFTERAGRISVFNSGQKRTLLVIPDVQSKGEGGLLGLAVDPNFSTNRFIYTCFNTKSDIRLVRWEVSGDLASLGGRSDIVSGMPVNPTGRHSGCRPRFGPDGNLWLGTGDVASGTNPQSSSSLGGKILRIDRNGQPVPGNLEPPYDARIFSYGHRNTQGLAMLKEPYKNTFGFSVEHGPDKDDELNPLEKGNFGWDPIPGTYNEKVPMTDLAKFPDAISALWKSGDSTIAPSGATYLYGENWKAWDGALAMAVLKGKHLHIFIFEQNNPLKIIDEIQVLKDFGRIRSAVQGPDGNLYLTTDNGKSSDQIIKVTPN